MSKTNKWSLDIFFKNKTQGHPTTQESFFTLKFDCLKIKAGHFHPSLESLRIKNSKHLKS